MNILYFPNIFYDNWFPVGCIVINVGTSLCDVWIEKLGA